MKFFSILIIALVFFATGIFISSAFGNANKTEQNGYILEHENKLAKDEPGSHNGGGTSTVYNYFSKAENSHLVFRKRVLHKGSAIGYHLQKEEEIYYILGGTGELTMNDKTIMVTQGDAILTFAGSSHGLKQTGDDDLIVLINYNK